MQDRNLLNILLIEDDLGDAKAVRRALSKAKVTNSVVHAMDGVEALEIMRSGEFAERDRYLVLLDLNMPRMNGVEFLQEIRRDPALNGAIVFVLTTSDDQRDITAAYDQNVAGYVLKGRVGTDFADLINMLDCFWRAVELPELCPERMEG